VPSFVPLFHGTHSKVEPQPLTKTQASWHSLKSIRRQYIGGKRAASCARNPSSQYPRAPSRRHEPVRLRVISL